MANQPTATDLVKEFTSRKLDWLKCCSFDRLLEPLDFKVGFVIIQHVNAKKGTAILSDETIADKTGGGSVRNVSRARCRLRDAGWLTWKRTRTANVYTPVFDKVSGTLDAITKSSDARRERRQERRLFAPEPRSPDRTPVSYLNLPDQTPMSVLDRTPVSDKHLRGNTLKTRSGQGGTWVREDSPLAIDGGAP
jgi:hypothetical protein